MTKQTENAIMQLAECYPHYISYISLSLEAFGRGDWDEEELLDNIMDAFPVGGNA
jgi:hypothetical protein